MTTLNKSAAPLLAVLLPFGAGSVFAATCPPNPTGTGGTALTVANATCTVDAGVEVNITSGGNASVTLSGGTAAAPTTLSSSQRRDRTDRRGQ